MKWVFSILLFFFMTTLQGGDTATMHRSLRGYKKWFYQLVTLHPRINSPIEKQLLKHYLRGSGEPFLISDADFLRLNQTVVRTDSLDCKPSGNSVYCFQQVVLDGDAYFGWGLGTITCIYNEAGELISFADVYDFNQKKIGVRPLKSEIATRIFRLLAPRSAKAFIVSYGKAAYWQQ